MALIALLYKFLTVTVKSTVFWDVTLCRTVEIHHSASFLLGLLFGPEHGGGTFLRKLTNSYQTTGVTSQKKLVSSF
jgi:hypothetical protein